MKNISTILSIIAIVLVGILFYLHFSHQEALKNVKVEAEKNAHSNFRIAYFDIDSLQTHYDYYKDALSQMKQREGAVNSELQDLKTRYQRRIMELQQKGPTMSQTEGEAAQREVNEMDQNYRQRESSLQDKLHNQQMELMKDLRKQIEDYLKEYNKGKDYAFILSYEPGFLMYYKDSAYNITPDLIKGLNDQYKNKKK